MEDDCAETGLGLAADVEPAQQAANVAIKQPKKRFVGRRQAAENAARIGSDAASEENNGAIQGDFNCISWIVPLTLQCHNLVEPQEYLIKCLLRYSMIPRSMLPSHYYRRTTPSRYTRPYTAFDRMAPRK